MYEESNMLKALQRAAAMVVCGICSFGRADIEEAGPMTPDFALKLFDHAKSEGGNVMLSPISIQSALAMAAQGAKGETQWQMLEVLRIKDPAALGALLRRLQQAPARDEPKLQLSIANALWAQQAYPFSPVYVQSVQNAFAAEARTLDFQQADASRAIINKWVEEATREKIKDLLPDGAITPDTRLVLTNAVYFKADWQETFNKHATVDAKFHVTSDKTTSVKMMHMTDRLAYFDAGASHVVRLPYVGQTASMLLLVPKAVDGWPEVEKQLTPELLARIDRESSGRRVQLSLPRFEFEDSTQLSDVLQAMGMKHPFDPADADFSAMTTAEKLAISAVLHKTYIKVDEEGTEAAGATAVMMEATAMPMPEDPIEVTADRPFLFLIRDDATGAILFIGRVHNPNG
jgi:serpin B